MASNPLANMARLRSDLSHSSVTSHMSIEEVTLDKEGGRIGHVVRPVANSQEEGGGSLFCLCESRCVGTKNPTFGRNHSRNRASANIKWCASDVGFFAAAQNDSYRRFLAGKREG